MKSRKLKVTTDRDVKKTKEGNPDERASRSSSYGEKFIASVVEREQREHGRGKKNKRAKKSKRVMTSESWGSRESDRSRSVSILSDGSTDDTEVSNRRINSNKTGKREDKRVVSNRTTGSVGSKPRRKTAVPIAVSKESAERELQLSREDWLRMDPAALGERLLNHLAELENQRARCSNISGQVAGRMKGSKQIATEISKAMIEKLTTVGDVFSLRNENFSLKEELNEVKRREQAQDAEIKNLR